MYNAHFGFREKPFKLVPDPDYLFLSRNHEIALAHLTYAVNQGDGFVVITGEVGTGKTTLCRIFLEHLDDDIESAYIFNPKMDSIQLLASICNEFGIQTDQGNLKQLLDMLNGYLITKSKAGRKVILLIDEAQNLNVENLEMVRMLSNLETTRNKLLQIILVGQPELGEKLDSFELRQLAQRISLSAHLTPLGFKETIAYIRHRIHIAAQRQPDLFTRGAYRRIFGFSGGTPRLINIACDRSLLTAFSLNRSKVTAAIAGIAIQELVSRGRVPKRSFLKRLAAWTAVAMGLLIAAGVVYTRKDLIGSLRSVGRSVAETAAKPKPPVADGAGAPLHTFPIDPLATAEMPLPAPPPPAMPAQIQHDPSGPTPGPPALIDTAMAAALDALDRRSSRLDAVARVLECWRQQPPNAAQLPKGMDDADYFDIAARQYGLRVYTVQSDWGLVKHLNLPAILPLKKDNGDDIVYLAMTGWSNGHIQLVGPSGQGVIQTTLDALLPHMAGPVYLYWKNALGFDDLIGAGSPAKQVGAVKNLLHRAGYNGIDSQPIFDQETKQAVIDFQTRYGLSPDGVIGPLTKIFLIQASNVVSYPRLNSIDGKSGA
jgi:general secretion pathway protein A